MTDTPVKPQGAWDVVPEEITRLTMGQFQAGFPSPAPSWRIGPFHRDDSLTFRQPGCWPDPTGAGWTSGFLFNPTLIVADDQLHLIYRAAPHKESLGSRIGHAVYTPEAGWLDDPGNPIVHSTLPNEVFGVEDPKIYRRDDGGYVLFYNAIWGGAGVTDAEARLLAATLLPGVGCDIMVAVSDDLVAWRKLGPAVPREVSQGWAKGAVIPRTPAGDAVRIAGEYLMFLSEGCGGQQTVGRSKDLLTWTFEPRTYLDLTDLGGQLWEVAFASTGHGPDGDLVLDFLYRGPDGELAAGQARYQLSDPLDQREIGTGGVLAWGGLAAYRGALWFAQGWDAPEGSRELYLYRTDRQQPDIESTGEKQ